MKSLAEQEGKTERVFLVGVELKQGNDFDVNESMAELAELATTAGATIIGEGTHSLMLERNRHQLHGIVAQFLLS